MLQRRETAALVYGLVMVLSACADDDAERFHDDAGVSGGRGAAASGGTEAGGESGGGESGGSGGAGGKSSGGSAAHGGSGGRGGNGGTGGGSSGETHDAGVDASAPASALHIDSFPPLGAENGVGYRYRVVLDRPGAAEYRLMTAPAGASIDDNGIVTWTPSDNQTGGTQLFELRARLDGLEATQQFSVSVPALTLSAEQLLPADDEHSAVVSVTSPLSAANGVSVKVPAGALSTPTMLRITTASGAPALPAADGADETPAVLGFGPSGSVFKAPVELLLPLSAAAKQRLLGGLGVASAWTLGADGRWQSLPIAQLDLDGGYVLLRTEHFSLFSVFAAPPLLSMIEHAQGGLACSDALFWNVGLTDTALSSFNSTWLNGTAQAASSSLPALLAALPAGAHVQLALRAQLSSSSGSYQQQRYRVFDLTKRSDGRIGLQVQDGDGSVLLERVDLAPDDAAIPPILTGNAAHFVLRGWPGGEGGHAVVDAFAYWRAPDAALGLPATEGQAFASLSADFGPPAAGSGDDDCDGLRNGSDPTPQGLQPPSVSVVGAGSLRAIVDTDVTLAVQTTSTQPSELQLGWSSDARGVTLTPSDDGRSASFRASQPGAYKVLATAKDSSGSASAGFTIFVDAVATHNTLPRCKISAAQTSVWTGDALVLKAVVADAEQNDSELSVRWAAANGGQVSSASGRSVSFTASTPASYEVSCVANDGVGDGPRSTLSIAVIDRPQNTPPRLTLVTPACATIKLDDGGIASQVVGASASDVDGDGLHFQFDMLDGTGTIDSYAASPDSAPGSASATVRFQTDRVGPQALLVRAIDQNGAASEAFTLKLLVVSGEIGKTDADGDGFPAGIDCNDADKAIYPGAPDACGDGVDQNCDGRDRGVEECDADGDGQSVSQGDCDDADPSVHTGAFERCNGRDDNCNGDSDEGFRLGADCKVGRGACVATGGMVCSPDGLAALCDAKPSAATPETCNGIDDDCNGSVDDVATTGGSDLGNCGGCGMTCTPGAHQVASCIATANGGRGCSFACSDGFIDLDRDPQNGCEYGCQANTHELCNGADDDCDGKVDEETATPVYTGPNGTLGIGDCRSGLQTCDKGQLVVSMAPVVPGDEHCDGHDNDCDGMTDEGFRLGESCDGPDNDLCPNGRRVCGDNGVVCGLESQHDLVDVCDGIDNDCNPKTPDGSADATLGAPCDEQNPSYCEPGITVCSDGKLMCSSEQRDRTSCKVCECDVSARCDTNGEGSFCGCDPQCVGPDVGCFCDQGGGCDRVDGASECGCDRECVGQTACTCDQDAAACDVIDGYYCACDPRCSSAPRCGCDANADSCDKTLAGDNCLCDADCYNACFCDDHIADTCAMDSDHHACRCDPSCSAGSGSGCACDTQLKTCDIDPQTQSPCSCDLDCRDVGCACNSTPACDQTSGGDACLCDDDCYTNCPCDDGVSGVCARDSSGNACICDPDCTSSGNTGCGCDGEPGACDTDPRTGMACACDKDCSTPAIDCLCDTTSGSCERASGGDACLCDRDCYTACACDDHDPATCALDSDGHACKCDPGCPPPTEPGGACDCNITDVCDQTAGGGDCLCDDACYSACACDDHVSDHCATDSDGHACQCDPGCQTATPPPTSMTTCACDLSSDACNAIEPAGDECLCDPQCYPACPCADDDPKSCHRDSDGNACQCDPGCESTPMTSCDCNTSPACDAAHGGGSCLCDVDCYPDCPCDDHQAGSCARDSAGDACRCDRDCNTVATAM
jgi:hypothetical protein